MVNFSVFFFVLLQNFPFALATLELLLSLYTSVTISSLATLSFFVASLYCSIVYTSVMSFWSNGTMRANWICTFCYPFSCHQIPFPWKHTCTQVGKTLPCAYCKVASAFWNLLMWFVYSEITNAAMTQIDLYFGNTVTSQQFFHSSLCTQRDDLLLAINICA